MIKETISIAFAIILTGLMVLIGTILAPLYENPSNWGVVISRFSVIWWMIIILIIGLVVLWKSAKSIDSQKDDKTRETMKKVVLEALKEDRGRK